MSWIAWISGENENFRWIGKLTLTCIGLIKNKNKVSDELNILEDEEELIKIISF